MAGRAFGTSDDSAAADRIGQGVAIDQAGNACADLRDGTVIDGRHRIRVDREHARRAVNEAIASGGREFAKAEPVIRPRRQATRGHCADIRQIHEPTSAALNR